MKRNQNSVKRERPELVKRGTTENKNIRWAGSPTGKNASSQAESWLVKGTPAVSSKQGKEGHDGPSRPDKRKNCRKIVQSKGTGKGTRHKTGGSSEDEVKEGGKEGIPYSAARGERVMKVNSSGTATSEGKGQVGSSQQTKRTKPKKKPVLEKYEAGTPSAIVG